MSNNYVEPDISHTVNVGITDPNRTTIMQRPSTLKAKFYALFLTTQRMPIHEKTAWILRSALAE